MRITELNGQYAKIGPRSITVKDENGKTTGVITHCVELANRDSSEIWGKIRKAVGLKAAECIRKMRKVDGMIVYLEAINKTGVQDCADKLSAAGIPVIWYRN